MSIVNDRLRECYLAKGWTYREFSDRSGISYGLLQKYITGKIQNIPVDKVKIMAKTLDVNPGYIMGWLDKDGNPEETSAAGEVDGVAVRLQSQQQFSDNPSDIDVIISRLQVMKRDELKADEREMLALYRHISPEARDAMKRFARSWIKDGDLEKK